MDHRPAPPRPKADQERTLRGRLRLAVTWGHNKGHRPDLKQLLYILTVTRDGAVPVQFRSRAATPPTTPLSPRHLGSALQADRPPRLLVCGRLQAGHRRENVPYIHRHGGRFLSVLPRTRGEDAALREILGHRGHWGRIHDKYDDEGELVDRFSIHEPEATSVEGSRLIWYHGTGRKAET